MPQLLQILRAFAIVSLLHRISTTNAASNKKQATIRDPQSFVQSREVLSVECRFRDNGTAGVCLRLPDCPAAISEMHSKRKLMPTSCGFERKIPIVCCKVPAQTIKQQQIDGSDRTSARACRSFQPLRQAVRPPDVTFISKLSTQAANNLKINVVGGVRTHRAEFPHMTALGWTDVDNTSSIAWKCGGTLISSSFVLTAAHCVRRNAQPDVMRIGLHDLSWSTATDPEHQYRIAEIIVHPAYRASRAYNDIALVRSDREAKLWAEVRPACLWQPEAKADDIPAELLATGFGLTEFGNHKI